jgi:hypothetical protein
MKYLLIIILFICACNFAKVSTVRITNNNSYKMDVAIYANNVNYIAKNMVPKSKLEGKLDFTNISKTDGQYIIVVKHLNDGSVDSFTHGYFTNGGLANYTTLEMEGHQVKVDISE